MKAYYADSNCTIFHGDSREILPALQPVDSIVTDPVWPNAHPDLQGADRPRELFAEAAAHFPRLAKRVAVQLGCDSDPRFLSGMPAAMPFFRVAHLEYVRPHYKGRLLYTGDVAYLFGEPPPSRKGKQVIPGKCIQTDAAKVTRLHPCARQYQHVRWLVGWFGGELILDPFMGTGTTLRAAKDCGYQAIGIEIEERFCELAATALSQSVMEFDATSAPLPNSEAA